MNNKGVILQISTGGYLEHRVSYDDIKEKLEALLLKIRVEAVIIGWSCDRELYKRVICFLKEHAVKSYLWLPVFSETGVLDSRVKTLITEQGTAAESYLLTEGENFEFYCPNQKINRDAFIELYEKHFSGLDFDGVFLDKIRYGTFSNGLGGVFNCFCPECMKQYEAMGLDGDYLKAQMNKIRLRDDSYKKAPLGIKSYEKGMYQFEDPIWGQFFKKKSDNIVSALEEITGYFKDRGLKVGMDVFAPFLGYFAGQDVSRLMKLADFVKPMMYRITNAPAGLPFETDCLIRETLGVGEEEKSLNDRRRFLEIIGCFKEHNDTGKVSDGFPMEFVKKELLFMAELSSFVYCGIEINKNHVAPATPEYVEENLKELSKLPIGGYVLSWDLLSAPTENIKAVQKWFGKGRQ